MPQPGDIVHKPRIQDVASTRDSKWFSHPPNVLYRQLVADAALARDQTAYARQEAAENIVEMLQADGGVFCKKLEENTWIVMDRREVLKKVKLAISQYRQKMENEAEQQGEGGSLTPRPRAPPKSWEAIKKKQRVTPMPPKAVEEEPSPNVPLTVYVAIAGKEKPIHPYALMLVGAVCNAEVQNKALQVLDVPLASWFDGGQEPEKERKMRLQLRQRYAGAMAMRISLVDFSKQLLSLWGGSLVTVKDKDLDPLIAKATSTESPQAVLQGDSPVANNNDNGSEKAATKTHLSLEENESVSAEATASSSSSDDSD